MKLSNRAYTRILKVARTICDLDGVEIGAFTFHPTDLGIIKRYNDLGEKLQAAQKAYDFTNNKLITGRQSVVQKGQELIALGAKENANRKIPMPELGLE